MTEKRKSPALRFRGYTDDWEQRKLGELLTQRVEHQKISEKEPLLAFSYAEGVIDPEDKKSNKRDFIMTDKYNKIFSRTEVEDIIYNPANVIHGAIHRNALKTGVVSPIYKIFKCNEDIIPKYMGEMLHTDKFISEITKYIEGTVVKLRTLSPEKFLDMEIELPKFMEEQEAIGSFFTNIDSLITLHQRKLELRFFPGCMFFIWVRMLTWCPSTEEQGFAGIEAPRPAGRSPICSQRRGARRRKNKALRGAKHHAQPAEIRFCSKDVVPGDGRTRRCGERSTTPNRPKPHFVPKTWCPATKEQGIGGSEAPRSAGRTPIWSQRRGARRRRTRFCRQHYPDIKGNYDF